jgi:ParB family transcriptional regulator, chromosome partitioning protein
MHTRATIASVTKDIPLNKLKPSPANVRKTGADVGVEEFAASITAHGLLQPLVVEPERNGEGGETGSYLVTAGERRRKALRLLARQKRIRKTEPIPCLVKADGIPSEISLAENVSVPACTPRISSTPSRSRSMTEASGSRRSLPASVSLLLW